MINAIVNTNYKKRDDIKMVTRATTTAKRRARR